MVKANLALVSTLLFLGLWLNSIWCDEDTRIIGGNDEYEQQGIYPYMISLQIERSDKSTMDHFCGGSLIDRQWVLTSASCVQDKDVASDDRIIYAIGGITYNSDMNHTPNKGAGQKVRVIEKYLHPFFSEAENDIALLYLEKPFTMTQYCRPIPVARSKTDTTKPVRIMGWGLYNYTEKAYLVSTGNLIVATTDIKPYSACNKTFPRSDEVSLDNVFCVGEYGKTACRGDEGSPLESDARYLIGIASRIAHDCDQSAVYTNVEPYVENFIYRIIGNRDGLKNELELLNNRTHRRFEPTKDKVPFAAAIHSRPKSFPNLRKKLCTGSFMEKQWVLTAAHCVAGDKAIDSELFVSAGVSTTFPSRYEPWSGEVAKVKEVFIHPNYQQNELANDIALLYLENEMKDGRTNKLYLAKDDKFVPRKDSRMITYGFSITTDSRLDDLQNNKLIWNYATETAPEECLKHFPNQKSSDIVCIAAHPKNCSLDSGGALYDENDEIILGVASVSFTPCGYYPTTYVKVLNHLDFLKQTMDSIKTN